MFHTMKFPDELEECSAISVIDSLVEKKLEQSYCDDMLEAYLLRDLKNRLTRVILM